MKKFLLTLLVVIVVAGALGAAGWSGYRYGLAQGASATTNGDVVRPFKRGNDFNSNRMPMHNNGIGPGFHHQGFGPGGGMMMRGGGFGFFSPFHFLWRIVVYGFIIWVIYKLLTGWRISFTQMNPKPTEPESKESQ